MPKERAVVNRAKDSLSRLRTRWAPAVKRIYRRIRGTNERVVTLPADGTPKGRVLFSYIIDPFLQDSTRPIAHSHTHFWESYCMAHTFVDAGYAVDVLHWTNRRFVPHKRYDFYVDVRRNFERIAPLLNHDCLKIFHAETAHYAANNDAQRSRLAGLEARRGIRLAPFKLVEENRAAEMADRITVLGNTFTIETFRTARKPVRRIPISAPLLYRSPDTKDFESCRRRFVWLGSEGFVHKGLDLVLDAFAGMPDMELLVCGPISREAAFERAYSRELYGCPNIRTVGWTDVASREFAKILASCVGLIYPSCCEGGGGCVVGCMHGGLIPIISRESSVDISETTGVLLPDCGVETIRQQVRNIASMPADRLRAIAVAAWSYARAHHTRDHFAAAYKSLVKELGQL